MLERAREQNGGFGFDGFAGIEELEIGGEGLLLFEKEWLAPDASGSTMIVVAGDGKDGGGDLADGRAGFGDGGIVDGVGIEEIAGDDDKVEVFALRDFSETVDGLEALCLEKRALIAVDEAGVRFADLPVRCV